MLWHQALLSLTQRYATGFSSNQRRLVLALCRKHHHPEITPEIRRALREAEQHKPPQEGEREVAPAMLQYEKDDDDDDDEDDLETLH